MSDQPEKRDRGTGSVFARGRMAWIQYSQRGVKIRESTGISTDLPSWEKKAEKLLRKKIGEVEAGVHRDLRQLRYEDLRDAFLADYRVNRRKSLRFDKKGDPYLDKVTRLDDFFVGYRASDVDADLVRKFTADQQGKGLANGSINRSISALRRMFNLAAEDGKLRNLPHFPMLKEAAPRQGFFESQQYEELARALPDYLRLPLAVGFFTGMRLGEILALQWGQVDFLAGAINLRAGETKNDEGRTVPIVPQLRALLIGQRSRRQPGCEFVCFRLDRKGNATKIRGFRKAWYRACIKAGLGRMEPVIDSAGKAVLEKPRGLRSKPKPKMVYQGTIFHDLRRTGVRNLVRAGVPERIAMTISGHRTRSIFERYNIVSPSDVVEAGRKLAAFHSKKFGHNSDTVDPETHQEVRQ
jgi:integrase